MTQRLLSVTLQVQSFSCRMLKLGDTQINDRNLEFELIKPRNLTEAVTVQDRVWGICLSNLCSDIKHPEGFLYEFTQHLHTDAGVLI